MAESIIEPNFTISDAALAALASLKANMTRDDPDNPPAVAMVAWGLFYDKQNQKRLENVIVSFYPRSQLAEVEHGIRVVSGLPLLNLPVSTRWSLVRRALRRQGRGGSFIQLSYGWHPPVAPDAGMRLESKLVWRNFPPAHVWSYRAP